MRADWFFCQNPESSLAQWQRRAGQQPRLYLLVFSIFWLMWTLAYMVAMHRHGPPIVAGHAAAHIGYSAILFGAILFPRQNWWLPMGLFAGLFALTLPNAEMQPFLRDGTGMKLGAVTFALNMELGLIAAYLAQSLAPRIVARHPQVSHDVVILCALFARAPLLAVAIHRPEPRHLPALDLRISHWSDIDPFGNILFHGYLINVTEENAREAKLRYALEQLTGQGSSNPEGIDIPDL